MRYSEVAVIILNYITWQESLEEAKLVHDLYGLSWEQIIIVDNHSPNESAERLRERPLGNYTFLESEENRGYASGNNIGLKYARSQEYRYAWILNNDILINDRELLSKMITVFEQKEDIAVVNPDIYTPTERLYNRDSKRMNMYDFTIGAMSYKKRGREIEDLGGYGYVYRPQGCCMLLDLIKCAEASWMDENTFLYCEEMILAERLLKCGYRCACLINSRVIHNHSKTVKTVFSKRKQVRIQVRSFDYYLKEYREYSLIQRILCRVPFAMKAYLT